MSSEFHHYLGDEQIGAKLHAQALEKKEECAARMMAEFVEGQSVCLSLSFGKDSMTLLHIAAKHGLLGKLAMVMWNNPGIETKDTYAFRDYVVSQYDLSAVFVETCPSAQTLAETLQKSDLSAPHPMREYVYHCLEKPRWEAMDERGINGTIIGLRADESRGRKISARMRGQSYYNKRELAEMLTPLSWWNTGDIFEYAAKERIPLHPVYAKALKYGVQRHLVRLSTPFDLAFLQTGNFVWLKREYPEVYSQVRELLPQTITF